MIYAVHRERDGDALSRVDLIEPAPLDDDDQEVLSEAPQPVEQRRRRGGSKGGANNTPSPPRQRRTLIRPADTQLVGDSSVALKLLQAVARGLPSRVRDLAIRVEPDGQFVISGVVSSYYSKQMAQHIAMEVIAPGDRLVNDIEVRTVR